MPVQDGAENKDKAQGAIKNNRLEVFEDKRYRYDTHGNLIEKKIGKHTVIQLTWDVEHQLQSAQVTKAAHTNKPVTTETKYRYDAFGRRLEKKDDCGRTLFEWDGNRLLSEHKGAKHKLYVYEADSFAPLAQIELSTNSEQNQAKTHTQQAHTAIKLIEPDNINDWQPRKTAQAFSEQMRALQRATIEKVKESQAKGQQQPDFDETRPPLLEDESQSESSNLVRLKDWRVRYYHNDHLGTPRELSDEGGDIVWQASYRAWGNTLKVELPKLQMVQAQAQNDPNAEPIEQNLRFQGQYYDEETGLHYNRFRYYDPDCGRFVSQDPIGLDGGDNIYLYAPNPTMWIDPFGLAPCFWNRIKNFRGNKVYQRGDIFDPNATFNGETNLQRMARGVAPIGTDGKSIELHHTLQTQDGPIAEMTNTFHKQNSRIIHINPNTIPSGIDRPEFNAWKRKYWKDRAKDLKASGC